jgi:hypothetical protein
MDLPKKSKREFAMSIVHLLKERQKIIINRRSVPQLPKAPISRNIKVLKSSKS